MARLLLPTLAIFLTIAGLGRAQAEEPDPPARAAVSRALPYIQERGDWWIEKNGCVSCHRVTFMTWALSDAQAQGFDVDAERLQEVREWSREALLKARSDNGKAVGTGNLEAVSQVLWVERNEDDEAGRAEQNAALVQLIKDMQGEDGFWPAGGQLPMQKRPEDETKRVSAVWNLLALDAAERDEALDAVVQRGNDAIASESEARSTEWYAMRLLLATQRGQDEDIAQWAGSLLSFQHDDGGWGWVTTDPSDALATGQALYALVASGVPSDDPAVANAVRFLTGSQNEDGSWTVNGTKRNKKDHAEETSIYWGTCWAVIGLVSQLDRGAATAPAE